MKCLQCGTELDRITKWRGPSEYCSDECKKASQDEFNRLAMTRLMQPRPARTSARIAVGAVRTVESGAGRLTVVTHPVGASSPIVTEPPEAGFIMEAAATLVDLQIRHQPPVNPRPLPPLVPSSVILMGEALIALEAMLSGFRPQLRPARILNPASRRGFARVAVETPAFEPPVCQPVWLASLGLSFHVAGIDSGSTPVSSAAVSATATAGSPAERPVSSLPVAHHAIPLRRAARAIPALTSFELGEERLIQAPVVSPPRLRIHLPKPALNPFRPRYAFAPAPAGEKKRLEIPAPVAAAPELAPPPESIKPAPVEPVASPMARPLEKVQPENTVESRASRGSGDREERKKQRGGKNGRPNFGPGEPKSPVAPEKSAPVVEIKKPEPKPEAKTETRPERREEREQSNSESPARVENLAIPSFGTNSDPEPEGFWNRMAGWQKVAAALVVAGIAIGAWAIPAFSSHNAQSVKLPSATAPAPTNVGPESWETSSSGDTSGIARRRVISHYKPAGAKRDYIFEFTGQIEQRAMGWVFRMKDARNYYCLKLEKQGEGPAATVRLVKFAVVNGEEQPHRLIELREPIQAGTPVKVRLDIRGQNFSTQVNGKPVDVWIDSQLASGTVGFSNETGERAVIRSVKVSY